MDNTEPQDESHVLLATISRHALSLDCSCGHVGIVSVQDCLATFGLKASVAEVASGTRCGDCGERSVQTYKIVYGGQKGRKVARAKKLPVNDPVGTHGNVPNITDQENSEGNLIPERDNELIIAAYHGDTNTVQDLISVGADIDWAREQDGVFPLLVAVSKNHIGVIKLLLAAGADPNKLNIQNGTYPLLVAAQNNHADVVPLLIQAGAQVGKVSEPDNLFPILLAALQGHASTVAALITAGANVNQRHQTYGTALKAAKSANNSETARILLEHGASEE